MENRSQPIKYIFEESEIHDLLEKEPERIEKGLIFIGKKVPLKETLDAP